MFVCAVSLSHPNSREWYLLYVKCLCLLSRYLSPVVENGICYMLNVCVCCLVISVPVVENGICYMLNIFVSRYLSPVVSVIC